MVLVAQYTVDYWLAEHISILWLLQHPLISLFGLMIALVLFSRLLMAIAILIDHLWLWLLRLPIKLFRSIFSSRGNTQKDAVKSFNDELLAETDKSEQILQKLQLIEVQQQEILQELAEIKNNDYLTKNSRTKLVKQIKGKG